VAFNTADAEKLRRYLAAHGVAVPAHVENGNDGSQWLNVSDPEGNKVQFVQPPAAPLPVTVNPVSVHIIHVGYMVHDPNAEDKFFRELLGFRPYWHGGLSENVTDWISQQVPDGTDWMEYMVVHSPVAKGIPPDLPQTSLGTMNHFSLGVFNMENTVNLLTSGGRLTARHTPAQIGADGKWQLNIWDSENTRAELMEFQPVVKPCCSEFTAGSPSK
jgi:catechol 2,3-dioxygenase-like lactoylglutathione lyase family enzyme